jgi:soluble lytic murein transglycosylase
MALLSVFLWLNRLDTGKQLEAVYQARAAAEQQVVNEHPYQFRELIEIQAEQNNLHPAFVASIVLNESSFRPGVKSHVDAMGLMQIRPDTGEYINRALDIPGYNHDMLYDPETNIRFGCYYLGELSRRFGGDPVLVAAAYNAGPTNVQNWLNNSTYSSDRRTIPIENIPFGDTQTYARRVMRDYAAYKRLYYEIPEVQE